MKHILTYGNWNNQYNMVLENMQAAKSHAIKHFAKQMRKEPNALTPEEQNQALNDPNFVQLKQLLATNPGYMGPFTKFMFDQRIPINELSRLLAEIEKNKQFLAQLPMTVDQYAAKELKPGEITGFEQLLDALRWFDVYRAGKWIIDELPNKKGLRDQARKLSKEEFNNLINIGVAIGRRGNEIKQSVMLKSMRYNTIQDFMAYAVDFTKSSEGAQTLIDTIRSLSPSVELLYTDGEYVVFSPRTESAQKKLCTGITNWCLNTGSWSSYVGSAVQINIFDFTKPESDAMFATGSTISYDGKVTHSHDKNDKAVKTTGDPVEHFTHLGYPTELTQAVVKLLPAECALKKVLDKMDVKNPLLLLKALVKGGYSLSGVPEEFKAIVEKELLAILDKEIKGANLDRTSIMAVFEMMGILSPFSFKLFRELFPDASIAEIKKVVDRSLWAIEKLQSFRTKRDAKGNPILGPDGQPIQVEPANAEVRSILADVEGTRKLLDTL